MALRFLGSSTKITIRWEPRGSYDPPWVEGMYRASFNVGGTKMDSVVLHVFNQPTATGKTPEQLGLTPSEMDSPRGYDVAARWACRDLLSGSQAAPHWRYGRAKAAAQRLWEDLEANGDRIRRRRGK